jgi:hypothetical protein
MSDEFKMDEEDDVVLHWLGRKGAFEAFRTKTYIALRPVEKGSQGIHAQTVTLEIRDAGPSHPNIRFIWTVTTDDGREIKGNAAHSLFDALESISAQWDKLG